MKYTRLLLWLAVAAIFFIPFLWYVPGHVIIGGDLTFPLDPSLYFESIFHIWRRVYTGVNSSISLTTLPFYAPMALFDWLGFSLATVQKFHFGLWLAAPAATMFYLAGVIFRDHPKRLIAQIVATVVFIFNPYQVVWGDSARMAIWIGLPLMLAFLIQGLRDKQRWPVWSIGIALASIITSNAAINPPNFLVFAAILAFWPIYHLIITPTDRTPNELKRIGFFLVVTLALAILVNLFWIIPYASVLFNDYKNTFASGVSGLNLQNWLDPLSSNTSLLNVFRQQGAWDWYAGWNGEQYVPAAKPYQTNVFYLLWSIIVPSLAIGAFLIKDKNIDRRLVIFFSFLVIVGLFVGAGSHNPSGYILEWLIEKFPILSIYRSPWYKFTIWTTFGYSILAAATVASLSQRLDTLKNGKAIIGAVVSMLIFGNVIYASGLVLGKVFPKPHERKTLASSHVKFPDYFFSAAKWVNGQPDDFRILQYPAQPTFRYHWGLDTLMDMTIFAFDKPTLWWPEQVGSGAAKPGTEMLVKSASQDIYKGSNTKASRLLGLMNVKYVLQKNDLDYSFYGQKDSPEFIDKQLQAQNIKPAHQEGEWQFYEIPKDDQRSLIFATTKFAQTGPTTTDFLPTLYSNRYDKTTTYIEGYKLAAEHTTEFERIVNPDLTTLKDVGQSMVAIVDIPVDDMYRLRFDEQLSATFEISNQPLSLEQTKSGIQSSPIELKAGKHELKITPASPLKNLVENPSFETGTWGKAIDASKDRLGEPAFKVELSNDATDGGQSMRMATTNHMLGMSHGIEEFELGKRYLISFDYKHVNGGDVSFSLFEPGPQVANPTGKLEPKKEWTRYSAYYVPSTNSTGGILHFYVDGGKENLPTEALFDNVKIVKLPSLFDNLVVASDSQVNNPKDTHPTPPTISYEKHSPTSYTVTAKGAKAPFFLNFLETYDVGWQATVNGKAIPTDKQAKAFGYANTWLIGASGDSTITLTYKPQQTFRLAAILSFIGIAGSLLYLWRRRRFSK